MEKVTLTYTHAWSSPRLFEANLSVATDAGFKYHMKFGPDEHLWSELLTPCCGGRVGGRPSGLGPRHCATCYFPIECNGHSLAPVRISDFAGWAEPHLAPHYPIFTAPLIAHDLQMLNSAVYTAWARLGDPENSSKLQQRLRDFAARFTGVVEGKSW